MSILPARLRLKASSAIVVLAAFGAFACANRRSEPTTATPSAEESAAASDRIRELEVTVAELRQQQQEQAAELLRLRSETESSVGASPVSVPGSPPAVVGSDAETARTELNVDRTKQGGLVIPPLRLGMTKEEVRAARGDPSAWSDNYWYYDKVRLDFAEGRLAAVDNPSKPLPRVNAAPNVSIRPGMTKNEVEALQGTPTARSGSQWYYDTTRLDFDGQRLTRIEGTLPTPAPRAGGYTGNSSGYYKPPVAENGDVRGWDNDGDGRTEPVHVRGYYRRDGTYVRGHYRARPRR